jgi:hypothetical protein
MTRLSREVLSNYGVNPSAGGRPPRAWFSRAPAAGYAERYTALDCADNCK